MTKRVDKEQIRNYLQQLDAGVATKELIRPHGSSDSRCHVVFDALSRCGYRAAILRRRAQKADPLP